MSRSCKKEVLPGLVIELLFLAVKPWVTFLLIVGVGSEILGRGWGTSRVYPDGCDGYRAGKVLNGNSGSSRESLQRSPTTIRPPLRQFCDRDHSEADCRAAEEALSVTEGSLRRSEAFHLADMDRFRSLI